MTPEYREMILNGQVTPVSQLSGAFLRPASPAHLQFAYFESSLVVEFLLQEYGLDILRRILVDLSTGMPIEESLQRYVGPPSMVDQQFLEFARQQAQNLAPQLDWRKDILPEKVTGTQLEPLLEEHPDNYWLMHQAAEERIAAGRWQEAAELLERLQVLFPTDGSPGNALRKLAGVYRHREQTEAERRVLSQLAELDGDAVDAFQRLMELARDEQDWPQLRQEALRMLAVDPLDPAGHEMLSLAGEQLQRPADVVAAQRALLQMDPADPARTHFRLAQGLQQMGNPTEARREVLLALEAAPRYRAAQELLLELVDHNDPP